jgi:predicted nucleic acid-binding protein
MRTLDTSIWIEIFCGSALGAIHKARLSIPLDIVVPTIVQYEIYKWMARERSVDQANRVMTFTEDCEVPELSTGIAVLAAEVSAMHRLHTTDAIIYATSQVLGAPLLTCDAHFKGLPGVEYFEKQLPGEAT